MSCIKKWQQAITWKINDKLIETENVKIIEFTGNAKKSIDSSNNKLTIEINNGQDGETTPFASGESVNQTYLTPRLGVQDPLIRQSDLDKKSIKFAGGQNLNESWIIGNATEENPLIRQSEIANISGKFAGGQNVKDTWIKPTSETLPLITYQQVTNDYANQLQKRISEGNNIKISPTIEGIEISSEGGGGGDTYWKKTSQDKTITPNDGYDNIDMTNKSITNILGLTSFINSAENFDIFNKDKNELVLQMGVNRVNYYNSNRSTSYLSIISSEYATISNWTDENYMSILSINHTDNRVDARWDAVKKIPLDINNKKTNDNYYAINSYIDNTNKWIWETKGICPDENCTNVYPDYIYIGNNFTGNDNRTTSILMHAQSKISLATPSTGFIELIQRDLNISNENDRRAMSFGDVKKLSLQDFNPSFKPFNIYKLSVSDQLANLKNDYATRSDQDQTKLYTFTDKGWEHVNKYKTWLDSRNEELSWNDENKTISMIYSTEETFLPDLLNLQGVPPIQTGFIVQSEVKYEQN